MAEQCAGSSQTRVFAGKVKFMLGRSMEGTLLAAVFVSITRVWALQRHL